MRSRVLDENGFVADFGEISAIVRQYDHRDLNEFFPNPTAEILAHEFYDQMRKAFPGKRIDAVTVYETSNCWAQFSEWED